MRTSPLLLLLPAAALACGGTASSSSSSSPKSLDAILTVSRGSELHLVSVDAAAGTTTDFGPKLPGVAERLPDLAGDVVEAVYRNADASRVIAVVERHDGKGNRTDCNAYAGSGGGWRLLMKCMGAYQVAADVSQMWVGAPATGASFVPVPHPSLVAFDGSVLFTPPAGTHGMALGPDASYFAYGATGGAIRVREAAGADREVSPASAQEWIIGAFVTSLVLMKHGKSTGVRWVDLSGNDLTVPDFPSTSSDLQFPAVPTQGLGDVLEVSAGHVGRLADRSVVDLGVAPKGLSADAVVGIGGPYFATSVSSASAGEYAVYRSDGSVVGKYAPSYEGLSETEWFAQIGGSYVGASGAWMVFMVESNECSGDVCFSVPGFPEVDILWSPALGAPFVLQTHSASDNWTGGFYFPSTDGQHVFWLDPANELKVSSVTSPKVKSIAVDGTPAALF